MFRPLVEQLKDWWLHHTDDILGWDLTEDMRIEVDEVRGGSHGQVDRCPGRRLSIRRQRRLGSVSPRPAHCITPVRGSGAVRVVSTTCCSSPA